MVAKTQCKVCSTPIEYTPLPSGFPALAPAFCDPCKAKRKEEETMRERTAEFVRLCPLAYRNTNPDHPGMPKPDKLKRILDWTVGPKGLVMHGPTRRGKTRSAWLLIKKLILAGHSVKPMQVGDLTDEIVSASIDGASWRSEMLLPDVVFLDDLGKQNLTERVEEGIFDVFERRTSHGKPFLITTNFTGDLFAQKFTKDRGLPLLARIREFCIPVSL